MKNLFHRLIWQISWKLDSHEFKNDLKGQQAMMLFVLEIFITNFDDFYFNELVATAQYLIIPGYKEAECVVKMERKQFGVVILFIYCQL